MVVSVCCPMTAGCLARQEGSVRRTMTRDDQLIALSSSGSQISLPWSTLRGSDMGNEIVEINNPLHGRPTKHTQSLVSPRGLETRSLCTGCSPHHSSVCAELRPPGIEDGCEKQTNTRDRRIGSVCSCDNGH